MSSLLPLKPTTSALREREAEPKLVDITESEADEILPSVSSATARRILARIYEEPRTASDVADAIDASVQNVSYHLDRLTEAGLVEVAETWYSDRGREMDVYAPANGPLVLYVGAERTEPSLRTALQRALGAVGLVGLASAVAHRRWTPEPLLNRPRTLAAPEPADPTVRERLAEFATGPGGDVLAIGLLTICFLFAFWYVSRYRPVRRRAAR